MPGQMQSQQIIQMLFKSFCQLLRHLKKEIIKDLFVYR